MRSDSTRATIAGSRRCMEAITCGMPLPWAPGNTRRVSRTRDGQPGGRDHEGEPRTRRRPGARRCRSARSARLAKRDGDEADQHGAAPEHDPPQPLPGRGQRQAAEPADGPGRGLEDDHARALSTRPAGFRPARPGRATPRPARRRASASKARAVAVAVGKRAGERGADGRAEPGRQPEQAHAEVEAVGPAGQVGGDQRQHDAEPGGADAVQQLHQRRAAPGRLTTASSAPRSGTARKVSSSTGRRPQRSAARPTKRRGDGDQELRQDDAGGDDQAGAAAEGAW